MKIKNLVAFAALALGAVAMPFAGLAAGDANGDICSLDAVNKGVTVIFPNKSNPLRVGEEAYILVRLLNQDYDQGDDSHPWMFLPTSTSLDSKYLTSYMYVPKISLSVGGKPAYAEYSDYGPNGEKSGQNANFKIYTDFYFRYTVQPGDIGLPVKLMCRDGKIPGDGSNTDLDLVNVNTETIKLATNPWKLGNLMPEGGRLVNFHFGPEDPPGDPFSTYPSAPHADGPHRNYSLENEGIFVQTVDFDPNYADPEATPEKVWREVWPKSVEYVLAAPKLEGVGPAAVWVWSENPEVFDVYGEASDITTLDGTNYLKVSIGASTNSVTFRLKGGTAEVGATAKIFMGTTTTPERSKVGDVLEGSTVSRTIRMANPPPPNVKVTFDTDGLVTTRKVDPVPDCLAEEMAEKNLTVPIYVTLSETFPSDFHVRLKVTLNDDPACDVFTNKVMGLSASNSSTGYLEAYTNVAVKAGTRQFPIYLYPLGADGRTLNGITIQSEIVEAAAKEKFQGDILPLVLTLRDVKPTVVSPTSADSLSADKKTGCPIAIEVRDCYRDLNAPQTYTVEYSWDAGTGGSTNGVSFRAGQPTTVNATGFSSKATKVKLRVTDAQGNSSAWTDYIPVMVEATKTVKPELVREQSETAPAIEVLKFAEGDTAFLRFRIDPETAASMSDMYAFLVPLNEASSNLVTSSAFTEGVPFEAEHPVSKVVSTAALTFLDGCAAAEDLRFGVTLRTENALTNGTEITAYTPQTMYVSVTNRLPRVLTVEKNNDVIPSGGEGKAVAAGVKATFKATLDDYSVIDITNKIPLVTYWYVTDGEGAATEVFTVTSTVSSVNASAMFEYTFQAAGENGTVQVAVRDKDMTDKDLTLAPRYSFTLPIKESPYIYFTDPTGHGLVEGENLEFYENVTKSKGYINVNLSEAPGSETSKTKPLLVKVSWDSWGADGVVTSETDTVSIYGNSTTAKLYLDLKTLDGGQDTMYNITAEVLNTTSNKYGVAWKDYYVGRDSQVIVHNVDPKVQTVTSDTLSLSETSTNSATLNVEHAIKWSVSDIVPDTTNGLKVTWSGSWGFYRQQTTKDMTWSADWKTASGVISNVAITAEGTQSLTMTVEDKDGGASEPRTWWFYIMPTKKVVVTPFGPAGSTQSKYDSAPGRGKGRVYTAASRSTQSSFRHTFYFDVTEDQTELYAFGYPAGADVEDNGNLAPAGYDIKLNANGGTWTTGNAYYKPRMDYDSFFYCWADFSEEAAIRENLNGVPKPSAAPSNEVYTTVTHEKFEGKSDKTYGTKNIEAIFSRELYASDNMGDINLDGIPDLYVTYLSWKGGTLGGVMSPDGKSLAGNDLTKVDGLNADEDYLPATYVSRYGSLIPDLEGTWVTYGTPFKAVTEIRGYHWGLNDAPSQTGIQNVKPERVYAVTDEEGNLAWDGEKCTLSELEFIAFTNWCGRQEAPLDPADKTNWTKWSPECPTDPTVADTDEDGFPDGYEYYFWYRAHVGYIDGDGTYRRMEGRRFDPTNPAIPVIIPADDIAELMNPRKACPEEDYNTRDSDNDGLIDAVEFERGTNPFDFDTDGDGLPDGYEIAVTGTDPLLYATDKIHPDGELNPDHDFKAETEMPLNWVDVVNAETPGATNRVWSAEAFALTNVETVVTEDPYETTTNKQVHSHGKLVDAWRYGSGDPEAPWALGGTNALQSVTGAVWTVVANGAEKVKVLHYQVFMKDGFDPRVGWNDPKPAKEGHIITTTPFTHLDEFLVMTFYYRNGGVAAGDLVATLGKGGRTWEEIWTDNCTNPLDADTDHDGMPDGWELYIQMGSGKGEKPEKACGPGPECIYSPLYDFAEVTDPQERDPDQDKLDFVEEFAGIESTGRYSPTCPTIQLTPDQEKWQNKWWCTNPYNKDTDDDGIDDGAEFTFIWDGAARKAAIDDEGCVEGGGLNPLSWDTDLDGLPDPFEQEFKGKGDWVADAAAAAPASTNATTNATAKASVAGKWNGLGLNGTINDAREDCDHDGLANWQEYMTGAMRCWRYDDTVNDWSDGTFDPVKGAYEYFSLCTNAFEQDAWVMEPKVYMNYYMFRDGYYHDLAKNTPNRFTERDPGSMAYSLYNKDGTAIFPHKYICTSPLEADTDHDGMDDYYELFHGLNPLLGESGVSSTSMPCDIVLDSYWLDLPPWSAEANYWIEGEVKHLTRPETPLRNTGLSGGSAYDFFQFPWLGGLARADVDGDNIRNQTESIMPGVQAASTYHHSDPTPLWMTDSSYGASLTKRYYYMSPAIYELDPPPMTITERWMGAFALGTMFSFEENEGFDSDHDFLGDFEETQGKTKTASDPQWHDSPLRRQAMWLNGEDAFLQTALPEFETAPNSTGVSTVGQNYLYFTVECWAKPDGETLGREQTLVERSVWTGPAGPADAKYLRKNFLIGIKNGRWYAKFDSDGVDKAQAVEITNGPEATTNWTHVAFTYGPANDDQNDPSQPMRPRLYVNGVRYNGDPTAIHPEHGVSALYLSEVNEEAGYSEWSTLIGPLVSFTVGASAETMQGVCYDILYRAGGLMGEATLDDYGRFYRGYIDEVRVWDGARLEKDIRHDYEQRVRYTDETALANREAFHKKWSSGGTRNPLSSEDLPARLMHHWSFDHIAGAVDPKDLMDVPAGFRTGEKVTDGMAVWARPKGWQNPWLNSVAVRSTVYTDTAWVPWINDTVGHLPRYDRTTVDSVYWSADYAGYLSAQDAGYAQFYFPRRGEVPSRWVQMCCEEAPFTQDARYNLVSTNAEIAADYEFTMLDRQTAGFDLLPMGGAYPRRISAAEGGMWDDQGAADAWAESGSDADHNGLPEWWERYARANYAQDLSPWEPFAWDTDVVCEGLKMKAWQAYMRDLARGMLPDGERHEEFIDSRDVDMDGIPDWWEDLYSIDTHSVADALADPDGDGLSNYVEYLITEKFKYAQLDPGEAKSDGVCVDYFRRVGDLYLGEIFTDHDQVNDVWENKYAGFADFSAYDPSRDDDGDGWSNFAEQKAGTDPRLVKETGIDDYTLAGYPVPCIRARIVNNGHMVETAPVVIKAWSERSDPGMTGDPDATWTIAGSATDAEGAQQQTSGADGEQKAGAEMGESSKYLGIKPDGTRTLTLGPGAIERNSVKIFYKDLSYCKAVIIGNQVIPTEIGDESAAQWYYMVHDREGKLYTTGGIFAGEEEVGTVDYDTGAVTIDFGNDALCGISLGDAGTTDADGTTPTYDLLNLDQSYVLVTWNSSARSGSLNRTLYLSDADDQGDISGRFDHVREGLNTFIAFVDRSGDGAYTPGEPFGVVRGVDVGWSGAEFEIELSETSAITPRISLWTGESDRVNTINEATAGFPLSDPLYIKIHATNDAMKAEIEQALSNRVAVVAPAEGKSARVRVVRYGVDDRFAYSVGVYGDQYVQRTVMDKVFDFDGRDFLCEADFLGAGEFDIDWTNLRDEVVNASGVAQAALEVSNMTYLVVIGDGPTSFRTSADTNTPVTALATMVTRRFEVVRHAPVAENVEALVAGSRPTFRWSIPDEEPWAKAFGTSSYTAFKLQILKEDGTTVVYDSDVRRAPAQDQYGRFNWTADAFVGDQTKLGQIFASVGNWKWRVAMYNAKFRPAASRNEKWSNVVPFSTSVGTGNTLGDLAHETIDVSVKYTGPVKVLDGCEDLAKTEGTMRLQAFVSPDFSGEPVAQGFIADKASLTNVADTAANGRLIGLMPGEYYLRAYVDTNGNLVKDDWESWGAAAEAVTVGPGIKVPDIRIYIEDADTDQDWIPDAWEMQVNGSLTKDNVYVLPDGQIKFKLIYPETKKAAKTSLKSAAVPVTFFQNLNAVRFILTSEATDSDGDALTDILAATQPKAVPGTVAITSLALDANKGEAVLKVTGETEKSDEAELLDAIYVFPDQPLTLNVYRKNSLAEKDWTLVKENIPVILGSGTEEEVRVSLGDEIDPTSGFYMIKVVQ